MSETCPRIQSRCLEELNSVPGSLAWYKLLMSVFSLDMEEKQFRSPDISSLVGYCFHQRKEELCPLHLSVLTEGSVCGFMLISFYMLFYKKFRHPLQGTQLSSSPCLGLHVLQSSVQVPQPELPPASTGMPRACQSKQPQIELTTCQLMT